MTYEEWVKYYESFNPPENGWTIDDYNRAEYHAMVRCELAADYPEYYEKYYANKEVLDD